jgi:hypothetical protein
VSSWVVRQQGLVLGFVRDCSFWGIVVALSGAKNPSDKAVRMAASRSRDHHWCLALDLSLVLALAVVMHN